MIAVFDESRFRRVLEPVALSDCPWLDLHEMLDAMRQENRALGGGDEALAHLIATYLAAFISLPVQGGPDQ